jgi:hypothetical protein
MQYQPCNDLCNPDFSLLSQTNMTKTPARNASQNATKTLSLIHIHDLLPSSDSKPKFASTQTSSNTSLFNKFAVKQAHAHRNTSPIKTIFPHLVTFSRSCQSRAPLSVLRTSPACPDTAEPNESHPGPSYYDQSPGLGLGLPCIRRGVLRGGGVWNGNPSCGTRAGPPLPLERLRAGVSVVFL